MLNILIYLQPVWPLIPGILASQRYCNKKINLNFFKGPAIALPIVKVIIIHQRQVAQPDLQQGKWHCFT